MNRLHIALLVTLIALSVIMMVLVIDNNNRKVATLNQLSDQWGATQTAIYK